MAFISNKERNKRVRQSNQSYGLRKLFISLTVLFLIILTVFSIVTVVNITGKLAQFQDNPPSGQELIMSLCNDVPLSLFVAVKEGNNVVTSLSGFGWFMAVLAVATIALAVVSLILMLTMKSPKAAKKNINVLQGAALSGKKLAAHANATQVYRERGTNTKKLKNSKKK